MEVRGGAAEGGPAAEVAARRAARSGGPLRCLSSLRFAASAALFGVADQQEGRPPLPWRTLTSEGVRRRSISGTPCSALSGRRPISLRVVAMGSALCSTPPPAMPATTVVVAGAGLRAPGRRRSISSSRSARRIGWRRSARLDAFRFRPQHRPRTAACSLKPPSRFAIAETSRGVAGRLTRGPARADLRRRAERRRAARRPARARCLACRSRCRVWDCSARPCGERAARGLENLGGVGEGEGVGRLRMAGAPSRPSRQSGRGGFLARNGPDLPADFHIDCGAARARRARSCRTAARRKSSRRCSMPSLRFSDCTPCARTLELQLPENEAARRAGDVRRGGMLGVSSDGAAARSGAR